MDDVGTDELVVLVDSAGTVIGHADRARMRRENLRHAATAVLVRHPDGRIYVHRRSPQKDWRPSAYDAAAGGVLRAGEPVEESARRELAEELGVVGVELRTLGMSAYEDDTTRVVEHCFEVTYAGVIRHADGEVVCGDWMALRELRDHLRESDWPFVPDTRALLERLCRDGVGDYAELELRGSDRGGAS